MKVGSLFSGYGGLDLAVEAVFHARPAWFVEFDKAPSRILAHHYPDVPNYGDITAVDWSQVEPVDIITGGFPCQDVSHAGKRAGLGAGTRTGLWANMLQAIDQLRPRMVVAENVRGLLSARADSDVEPCPWCMGDGRSGDPMRALGAVLADLADVGYNAAWTGLRAADVGAPHGRFRVFILAWPAANTPSVGWHEGWPESAGLVRGSHAPERGNDLLFRTPTAQLAINGGSQHPDKRKLGGHGPTLADEVEHLLPTPLTAAQLMPTPTTTQRGTDANLDTREGARANLHNEVARLLPNSWGDYAPAIARWEALTRPAPAPTEPTGRDGAHRLSPRFVEWMMGLPDGWVNVSTDAKVRAKKAPRHMRKDAESAITRNQQLKMLGNGVVPQQAEAALHHLLAVRAAYAEVA